MMFERALALLLLNVVGTTTAFVVPTSTRASRASAVTTTTALSAIGLGPDKSAELWQDKDLLVAGVDFEVPNHEEHRLDRRSKLDEQCDTWFASLLNGEKGMLDGTHIADNLVKQLHTVPELINDEELPREEVEWTPYVNTKLPWSVLRPAYGLEQFGIPVPRRNAETWRQFDVAGMVNTAMDGSLRTSTETSQSLDVEAVQRQLVETGGWLDDTECAARLIYVNGEFCPELSMQTDTARNLQSVDGLSEEVTTFLGRLTDGWTDELQCPVPMQQGADSLTSYGKLSTPNHNVGPAHTQFAINTQQGTACFAALNTLKCTNIAYVHDKTVAAVVAADDDDTETAKPLPVFIVHAVTPDGGVPVATSESTDDDTDTDESTATTATGVAIHPRTVIIADEHAHVSVVQQSVTLGSATAASTAAARPMLYNGYTQVWLKNFANVTHTVIEESGGLPIKGIEQMDDVIRKQEADRPALKNTVLENLDVHCAGTASCYTGTVLSMGGSGRVRMATSIALLKPTSSCNLSGFALTGGVCRHDVKTCIHHMADGCNSQQLQKNMVAGRAVASFRGRIRVEQSAQQTNSQQLSRTVLLTDKCRAWAVPSLEIIADDVQCTHGATVSDLSEEELFYLRSRGLSQAEARNLLMYAFCNDVVNNVPTSVLGTLKSAKAGGGVGAVASEGLQMRILRRLENLVPTGERAVRGEFQSS